MEKTSTCTTRVHTIVDAHNTTTMWMRGTFLATALLGQHARAHAVHVSALQRARFPLLRPFTGTNTLQRLCCSAGPQSEVIADIQVLPSPSGTAENEFEHVEAAIAAIASSGLKHSVHALGTTIEGPADEVWAAARAAFDATLESGASQEMMILKVYQGKAGRSIASLEASGQAAADGAVDGQQTRGSQMPTAEAPAERVPVEELENAEPPIAAEENVELPNAAEEEETAEPPKTVLIHAGSRELPPLVQVPGGVLPLTAVVKPPDADTLWQWEESRGNVDADSSWASVWPAAANLAYFVANAPSLVQGRRVAELGAGLGIVGLTAAKVGAATVTLVDREPLALHCAMSTAVVCGLRTGPVPDGSEDAKAFYAAQGHDEERGEGGGEEGGGEDGSVGGVVSATMADWGALASGGLEVDVVVASEVLYDPAEAAPLARSAAQLLRHGGELLLADPTAGRFERARAAAADALRDLGASVSEQPLPSPPAGDGWYSLRAGDGRSSGALPSEPIVLLRAVFEKP